MSSQYPPKKNTAFTLDFTLYKNDCTVIANPGTITKKISIDGGDIADITADVTEENTTYGQLSLVLSAAEMNGDRIWIQIKDDTVGCVPFTVTLLTVGNTQDELKAVIDNIHDTDLPAVKTVADGIEFHVHTTIPALIAAIPAAVWDYLTTAMTTVGSIGKRMAEWFSYTSVASSSYGATDLVLCNNALMLLGNEAVANLTDTTKKGVRLCTQFYQQAVDEALRAYTWNCALTRVAVTVDGTAPAWGYAYRYALPAGCLRVVGMDEPSYNYKFKIENGYLLTDEATCNLHYIARITPENMDVLLRRTVSARLASLIAFPLTNSTSLAEAMFKLYKDCLQEAETVDAFEGTSEQLVSDDWINSRS